MTTPQALSTRVEELRAQLRDRRTVYANMLTRLESEIARQREAAATGVVVADTLQRVRDTFMNVEAALANFMNAQARLEELQGLQLHLAAN